MCIEYIYSVVLISLVQEEHMTCLGTYGSAKLFIGYVECDTGKFSGPYEVSLEQKSAKTADRFYLQSVRKKKLNR